MIPSPGETIFLEISNGRNYSGEFVGDNVTGVGILENDRYRFFPWTSVVSMWKEIE